MTDIALETAKDEGTPVIRMAFRFPLGRHMYFTPFRKLSDVDIRAYSGIRLTYMARLQQPLNEVLVLMVGQGEQYIGDLPKADGTWRTCVLPFDRFRGADWSQVKGKTMDAGVIDELVIGCHGTAKEDGVGEILVKKLELVP